MSLDPSQEKGSASEFMRSLHSLRGGARVSFRAGMNGTAERPGAGFELFEVALTNRSTHTERFDKAERAR